MKPLAPLAAESRSEGFRVPDSVETAPAARVGFANDKWDAAVFVNNVTDERAFLALDQERGTLARVGFLTNQPRTYGVSTRIKF